MMLALATAAAALAVPQAPPISHALTAFDLPPAATVIRRERAAPTPLAVPRNLDLRDFAVDMPELVVPLSENGPRLLVGAFGGRGKGMPKLAHVGLGWTF